VSFVVNWSTHGSYTWCDVWSIIKKNCGMLVNALLIRPVFSSCRMAKNTEMHSSECFEEHPLSQCTFSCFPVKKNYLNLFVKQYYYIYTLFCFTVAHSYSTFLHNGFLTSSNMLPKYWFCIYLLRWLFGARVTLF